MSLKNIIDTLSIKENPTTFAEHLEELRKRIIYSLIVFMLTAILCYIHSTDLYNFLLQPLNDIEAGQNGHKIIYTDLTEAFFTYLKLAVYAGFFLSFPHTASQIYLFLSPGLYKRERMVLIPYLIAAPLLFLLGAAIAYYYIFPLAWKFFLSFELPATHNHLPVQFEAKISEYLSLVLHIIFAFGVAFQLPVILTLFTHVGFIDSNFLITKRRLAIVIIFAIAAIITPPDIFSQIALAIPMLLLYEISIVACRWIEKQREEHAGY